MSLQHHWASFGGAFRHLIRQPFSSLLTLSVLAIALALPAGLFTLLHNAGHLLSTWQEQAQVSLFLRDGAHPADVQALQRSIGKEPGIRQIRYVSKDAAREELERISGFGHAFDALNDNPLPASLVVGIDPTYYHPAQIERLARQWAADPQVQTVRFDLDWVARLQAILAWLQRGVAILAALLAVGVVVIVGNTIRLGILNRREEIAVAKLVGASNGFVRLPFLYHGLVQGTLAGVMAWAIVALGIALLQNPTVHLAALYGSLFRLNYLSPAQGAILIAIGAGLGFIGSLLVAGRHIRGMT